MNHLKKQSSHENVLTLREVKCKGWNMEPGIELAIEKLKICQIAYRTVTPRQWSNGRLWRNIYRMLQISSKGSDLALENGFDLRPVERRQSSTDQLFVAFGLRRRGQNDGCWKALWIAPVGREWFERFFVDGFSSIGHVHQMDRRRADRRDCVTFSRTSPL